MASVSTTVRPLGGRRPAVPARSWLVLAAAGLTAAAVIVTLRGAPPDQRTGMAIVNGLLVGTPMAVGLAALRAQPRDRFATLLLVAGAAFSLTVLCQAHDSLLYSTGRVAVWLAEPLVVFLMLAFPSGRLLRARDRRLVGAVVVLVATLYLPSALIDARLPSPSPFATCGAACPANAFAVADLGVVESVIRPLREILVVLAVAGVGFSLAERVRTGSALMRRALEPVLLVAVVQVVAFVAYQWVRRNGTVPSDVELLGRVYVLLLPLVAASFAAGLLRRRLGIAAVLRELTLRLRAPASAAALRRSLADALEDPTLRIVYRLPGAPARWVDETGWPVEAPASSRARSVTEVISDGRPVAAVVHDPALAPDPRLVEAAAAYGMVVLENTQLITELQTSLRRLSEAEERTVAVAEGERRKIERDLHDGAQQRLLALRIRLAMTTERLRDAEAERAAELDALGDQIDQTIEDVRALARSSYPPELARNGLTAALRSATLESGLPATVLSHAVGRYSPQIESAVYFSCLEALQNAVKHADGATAVRIVLAGGERLRFEVVDDGPGFARAATVGGSGLESIRERLASVGGWLSVHSTPGRGTRVAGSVPVP